MSWFGSDDKEEEVKPKPRDGGWELLEDEEDFSTWRRKVPGGWLIRTEAAYTASEGLTFLPDPNHEWRV